METNLEISQFTETTDATTDDSSGSSTVIYSGCGIIVGVILNNKTYNTHFSI